MKNLKIYELFKEEDCNYLYTDNIRSKKKNEGNYSVRKKSKNIFSKFIPETNLLLNQHINNLLFSAKKKVDLKI